MKRFWLCPRRGDPKRLYERVANYTDLPPITIDQIRHFFEHYKDLEPDKWVKIKRWGDAAEAHQLISRAIARANPKAKSSTVRTVAPESLVLGRRRYAPDVDAVL